MVRAPDPAPKLMDLCEAEAVGAVYDDRVRRRHVDAAFDDRGADQHVEAAMVEVQHELLEIPLPHLTVPDRDVRLGHELAQRLGGFLDGLDGIVHVVDLSAAADLAQHGLADHRLVPLQHEGLDGQALGGRRGDERQVAQAAHGHVESARNRRRGPG